MHNHRLLLMLLLLFALLAGSEVRPVCGQGYKASNGNTYGASNSYLRLQTLLKLARTKYSKNTKEVEKLVRAVACSEKKKTGTMCGSGGTGSATADKLTLLLIMSPSAFDARTTPIGPAKAFAVSPAKQQHSCYSCSAFAVAAAAESAVAAGAGVNGSAIDLSEQQLYYCSTDPAADNGRTIMCDSGMTVETGLGALTKQKQQPLLSEQCMQYNADEYAESDSVCTEGPPPSESCKSPPYVADGTFKWSSVSSAAKAQQFIRERGGVISRFDIYDDFAPFYNITENKKKVYAPGPNATFLQAHAVFIVGYNNDKEYYIVKNSWGPQWADGGFFRVKYGTAGILSTDEVFTVVWQPSRSSSSRQPPLPMTPAGQRPDPSFDKAGLNRNCFYYKATSSDYLSGIAYNAGIKAATLLEDNQQQLSSLDAPISGRQFLLCDVPLERRPPEAVPLSVPAVSAAPAAPAQRPPPSRNRSNTNNLKEHQEMLLLAASPASYDGRDSRYSDGVLRVSPPSIDQGDCSTCVPFTVTAAAQTAVAAAMHVNVSSVPAYSIQSLHFCGPGSELRTCSSGWELKDGLSEFVERAATLPTATCAPYRPEDNLQDERSMCKQVCPDVSPFAKQGVFKFQTMGSSGIAPIAEVQDWIRKHGAVISRFGVYDDLKPFFNNPGNAKKVYSPGKSAKFLFGHAVVLVGYNNEGDQPYWLAKNSWGPMWADGGFFKVAYGSVAEFETYGVRFIPNKWPAASLLRLTKPTAAAANDTKQDQCYLYKASPGDYLSKIAWRAGIPLDQFLLNNTSVIKDLQAPLTGLVLRVCKPEKGSYIIIGS